MGRPKLWYLARGTAPTTLRGLLHPFPTLTGAPSSLLGCPGTSRLPPFPHPSPHALVKGRSLPAHLRNAVGKRRQGRIGGREGRWARGCALGSPPPRACRTLTLELTSVSGPSVPHPLVGGLAASLPERGAPGCAAQSPPGRPAHAPPAAAGNRQLPAPAAAAAAIPDPTLQLPGARAAAGGVGREGK